MAYTVGGDGRGRLWILENDFAGGVSGDSAMKIYEVLEPDPDRDRSARLAGTYRFEYPGDNADTEAIFALGGKLLVVSKTSPNRVYRLPSPMSRTGTNQLIEVGGLDATSLLTGVGMSGDEQLLVTVGITDTVRVFENRLGSGDFSAFDDEGAIFSKSMPDTQREAIDFFPYNGCSIISLSEDGTVWRLSNPRMVYPEGVAGPPTAVSVVAGEGSVHVTWSPPSDPGGSGITGYRVAVYEQAVEIASVTTPDGSTFGAQVSNLTSGVAYTFSVAAINATGEGPPSPATDPVTPGGPAVAPGPTGPAAPQTPDPPAPAPAADGEAGYWMLGSQGSVYAFGAATHRGEPAGGLGGATAVDLEPTPSGAGYWVLDDRGAVSTYGDAQPLRRGRARRPGSGRGGHQPLRRPRRRRVLDLHQPGAGPALRHRPPARGVADRKLNGPVLDSVATPTGLGYYMVASDGGIFTFGDAAFSGSMGGQRLNAPVQSLVPDGDGAGYWLVASDGGIFSFEAPFRGSLGSVRLNKPITGMVPYGNGYLMVGEDGGIFNFSDRPFSGSLGDRPPAWPVVSVAALD